MPETKNEKISVHKWSHGKRNGMVLRRMSTLESGEAYYVNGFVSDSELGIVDGQINTLYGRECHYFEARACVRGEMVGVSQSRKSVATPRALSMWLWRVAIPAMYEKLGITNEESANA